MNTHFDVKHSDATAARDDEAGTSAGVPAVRRLYITDFRRGGRNMTTTELIALLKENEFGASGRPREISFGTKEAFMAEPKITVSSTGDGICGPEITLYLEPKRIYREIRSNADEIRAMTDEHLAGAIDCPLPRQKCPKSRNPDCCCYTCKLHWLRQEA